MKRNTLTNLATTSMTLLRAVPAAFRIARNEVRKPFSKVSATGEASIWEFLEQSHVVAIAANDPDRERPWVFNAFYVFDRNRNAVYFLSMAGTRHVVLFEKDAKVSGVISTQPEDFAAIKGIQFLGTVRYLDGAERESASKQYYQRFPLASLMKKAPFWAVDLEMVKFTNNEVGFGTKIYWPSDATP